MSEDISDEQHTRSIATNEENQSSKRRRRSGWDIQAPVADSTVTTTTTTTTASDVTVSTSSSSGISGGGGGVSGGSISASNVLPSIATTSIGSRFIQPPPPVSSSSLLDPTSLLQQAQLAQLAQQNQVQQQLQLAQQQALLIQNRVLNPLLGGIQAPISKPGCRIYIGSIHYDLKESDIVTLFSSFGTITKSEMSMDSATGKSKGFCFLEYTDQASALAAHAMDGFELAGRKIKVGRPYNGEGAATSTALSTPGLAAAFNPLLQPTGAVSLSLPQPTLKPSVIGLGGTTTTAVMQGMTAVSAPQQDKKNCLLVSNVNGDIGLKDLETMFSAFGSIISCQFLPFDSSGSSSSATAAVGSTKRLIVEYTEAANAISTWLSMNNFKLGGLILQCEVITLSAARQLLQPITAVMSSSYASSLSASSSSISTVEYKVVLLNNMITVEDTKDPDLKDEIAEEAKNYGDLLRVDILVDHVAVKASVKLLYKDANGAARAVKAMNNRNFGGNTIAASLVPE